MSVMSTRRDFLRQSAELTALLLASIQRAAAIDPAPGSTFEDAEHVVILMQENRSFDHLYGMMRGVRGYNDPRAVTLPDGNPVWKQSDGKGLSALPFRLDLRGTRITWLGSLPHGWDDQTDARANGNHDQWLVAKPSSRKECAGMPLTMGYYNREDLPFYYALADAFTICDQNFCSSLTGTTPNRLYLWTGKIQDAAGQANVRNSEVTYTQTANWTTFPERLEAAGVSWKIYQNELSLDTGLDDEEEAWLANYTDNPIEWFDQFHVGFHPTYQSWLREAEQRLPGEIDALRKNPGGKEPSEARKQLQRLEALLKRVREERAKWSPEAEAKLSARDRALHAKAFATNRGDANYRTLETIRYRDGAEEREMKAPAGDLFYQFRKDVQSGKLPKVSWLVAPKQFSDHPSAPWYGAWYLAESINILTQNPEVWKKTIFILTYDENDGYFDHVPPFVSPDPSRPETGCVSAGIDARGEYWPLEMDRKRTDSDDARGGPIGLGFRVPMVVASPWSRGGYVCSQVFDHTSVVQLLERVCKVKEPNISPWRRAVCGDMSAAFRPFRDETETKLPYPARDEFLGGIHQAQFRPMPSGWVDATMPRQEPGVRPSLALPYELSVEGEVREGALRLRLAAGTKRFGARSAGCGFHAYTPGKYRGSSELRTRAYAVKAGETLSDQWDLSGFPDSRYEVRVCGPNGFFRSLAGSATDPAVTAACRDAGSSVEIVVRNNERNRDFTIQIADRSYGQDPVAFTLRAGAERTVVLDIARSQRWYDLAVSLEGIGGYERHYAGRAENGEHGISDPAMA